MSSFEKIIEVRWQDCDANGHVRHSAYYDYGAHARIRFFNQCGFGSAELKELGIGPVLFKEECAFIKELHLNDTISINILKGELEDNGRKWILHHEIFDQQHTKCAQITAQGSWLDLNSRRLTYPPKALVQALDSLPLGDFYVYKK